MAREPAVSSRLSRALGAIGQGLLGAGRYLGPLLRDTLVYAWKTSADLFGAGQWLWRRWQVRRRPETGRQFAAWRESFDYRRTARWAPWRALTTRRRMERRAATLALALALFGVARTSRDRPSSSSAWPSTDETVSPVTMPAPGVDGAAIDRSQAVERMRSDMARATAGEVSFLADIPVLALGSSERWNGFRIAAPAVLRDGDSVYRLWYRGCRLHGIDHGCAIGYATSADGLEWTASPEPVLVPANGSDEFDLGSIAVVRASSRYFMWYSLWPDRFDGRPTSELYVATSADGTRWEDHGRVLASEEPMVAVQPSVVHDGGRFHLWFVDSRRAAKDTHDVRETAPFLRHFTSPDGRAWQEQAEFAVGPLDRGRMHVSVARDTDGSYRAFYFGRAVGTDSVSSSVGWLVSADGSDWRLASTTAVPPRALGGDVEYVSDATAVRVAAGTLVWFVAAREGGRQDIRAAFLKE
jgi:hypothetical protein